MKANSLFLQNTTNVTGIELEIPDEWTSPTIKESQVGKNQSQILMDDSRLFQL
jgi:hypothetical protein